jgi:hypothetical protein
MYLRANQRHSIAKNALLFPQAINNKKYSNKNLNKNKK